ncbi:hypothetical protein [Massilia aerilata]|uniref:Uncharacterized protein n=1 Tax=Massilia aerilata TaxID=453817 RepID=A0ABW0S126_9BURK
MTRLDLSLIEPAPKAKSKAAQIAELLPEIEEALAAGHSHLTIFEQIKNKIGLELSFGYYENTLHRLRQRKAAKNKVTPRPQAGVDRNQIPQAAIAVRPGNSNDAPTSKLQAALGEPVDDFFS